MHHIGAPVQDAPREQRDRPSADNMLAVSAFPQLSDPSPDRSRTEPGQAQSHGSCWAWTVSSVANPKGV